MILTSCSGIRLYYSLIPLCSWAVSSWALLVVCPLYVLVMRDYDNNQFLEEELDSMYKSSSSPRTPPALHKQESLMDVVTRPSLSSEKL